VLLVDSAQRAAWRLAHEVDYVPASSKTGSLSKCMSCA
jgi:hypothetical protein